MLAPHAVVAEVPAVVAPQDDDRVLVESVRLEGVEHLADLRVGVAGGGVIAVDELTLHRVVDGAGLRAPLVVAQLAPIGRRELGGALWRRAELGEFELRRIVEVPILLRCVERQVGPQEPDGDEERLVRLLGRSVEPLHRFDSDLAVRVRFVVDLGRLERRTAEAGSLVWLSRRSGCR